MTPGHTEDGPLPRRDNLHATAQAADMTIKPHRFGGMEHVLVVVGMVYQLRIVA